jgi:dihydropyrimidinase
MDKQTILIRGGQVVTAEMVLAADMLIQGETIQAIGKALPAPPGAEVVDASDLLVLPGVIDAHVHIQLDTGIYRTPDSWAAETRAAAFGGVTTVIDFATQFKGQTFEDALAARMAEASPSCLDYAFHMMVTDVPPGQEDELGVLPELGIQSIKLYTTYRPNYYADDAALLRLLEAAGRYGLIALIHCENDALVTAQTQSLAAEGLTGWAYHGAARPALAEQEAAGRVLFLAEAAGAPVVIAHNSTGLTAALVANARKSGQVAFSETALQYLLLDDTVYDGAEPWRYILQPPLRAPEEKQKLWELVGAGLVDMLITDHCAYTRAQKQAADDFTQTPGGLPGLETLLPLLATYGVAAGRIGWPDVARMLAANPAHIYNLWPRKGALLPGADADLVLYDPAGETFLAADALHSTAGYTPFEGLQVQGRVVAAMQRGQFLVRNGDFVGAPGRGRYLKREPFFWH